MTRPTFKVIYEQFIPNEMFKLWESPSWDRFGVGRNLVLERVANNGRRSEHPALKRLYSYTASFDV